MRDELEQALMVEGDLLAGRQIIDLSPVGGGSVGSSWRVTLSTGEALVVKLARPDNLLAEQSGLAALRQWADPALIEVLKCWPICAWVHAPHS